MAHFLFKYDLAREYFPGVTPATARRLLHRELQHNTRLWAELQATGYRPSQKRFTPLQVQIIFRYLGEL